MMVHGEQTPPSISLYLVLKEKRLAFTLLTYFTFILTLYFNTFYD